MLHTAFRPGLLALGALVLGACATLSPAPSASQLVDFPGLRKPDGTFRDCAPSERPRVLPAAAALVDSAALVARLASLPEGTAVYSLLFSGDGALERSVRIDGAAEAPSPVDAVLAGSLRRQGGQDERWGVQLRVTSGPAPGVRVGRQEYCPVMAWRRVETPGRVGITGEEGRNTFTDAEMAALAMPGTRLRVTAAGEVAEASLRGPRAHVLTEYRFHPALIDRIPVDTVVEW